MIWIILLNWNRVNDTLECLASLRRQSISNFHVLVVDQNSSDGSQVQIAERFPEVKVLANHENSGFARGMNLGIRFALDRQAETILLLNNDTIAAPAMLELLLKHASSDHGIVAPAIFYADAPDTIWSTGGGIQPLLLEMTGDHGRNQQLPMQPVERDFLSGCAMLVRRAVFERVGIFDERFFMYYEDLDFCLRVRQAGYKLLLVPSAHLWHKVSQSSGGSNSPNERYQMARSSGLYFRKQMNWVNIVPIVGYRLLSALRWSVRLARQRQWESLRGYWRGLYDGWFE